MSEFDLQPSFEGRLVKLRPLRAEDFEALFAVSSDPLVWEQHPMRDRYKREVFDGFFKGAMDSRGALLALDAKTGEVIGSSRFSNVDWQKNQVEVGYTFLARRCWGGGYNQEMKAFMLAHAFEHVERVIFYIGENNRRSRIAIERLGAKLVEILPRKPAEGAPNNSAVYVIESAAPRVNIHSGQNKYSGRTEY